jgi:hypothetical protein
VGGPAGAGAVSPSVAVTVSDGAVTVTAGPVRVTVAPDPPSVAGGPRPVAAPGPRPQAPAPAPSPSPPAPAAGAPTANGNADQPQAPADAAPAGTTPADAAPADAAPADVAPVADRTGSYPSAPAPATAPPPQTGAPAPGGGVPRLPVVSPGDARTLRTPTRGPAYEVRRQRRRTVQHSRHVRHGQNTQVQTDTEVRTDQTLTVIGQAWRPAEGRGPAARKRRGGSAGAGGERWPTLPLHSLWDQPLRLGSTPTTTTVVGVLPAAVVLALAPLLRRLTERCHVGKSVDLADRLERPG